MAAMFGSTALVKRQTFSIGKLGTDVAVPRGSGTKQIGKLVNRSSVRISQPYRFRMRTVFIDLDRGFTVMRTSVNRVDVAHRVCAVHLCRRFDFYTGTADQQG
jgi:hypothetical protein